MSYVKWICREYSPTDKMPGKHGFYAEVEISNEIDNAELARKIAARTGFKSYECQAIVAAAADIVAEEVLEGNRISMSTEAGMKMVTIYPKVSGSINDDQVLQKTTAAHALNPKEEIRSVAEESDLTPDLLTWTLGATVGTKFSQEFALHKHAQKVTRRVTATAAPSSEGANAGTETPDPGTDPGTGGGDNGGGTGTVTPSGGDNGGNSGGGNGGNSDTGGQD